jgi:hypothetical protein
MRWLRGRLTYANVMSTLAVFFAISGGAYAASQINGSSLKSRTVAGKKLKVAAVTHKEIGANAVGSEELGANAAGAEEVAQNAVGADEIAPSAVGPGELDPGLLASLPRDVEIVDEETEFTSINRKDIVAQCPEGKKLIGGGADIFPGVASGGGLRELPIGLQASYPTGSGSDRWYASAIEMTATGESWTLGVHAICARR